jgi:hypothetical protein
MKWVIRSAFILIALTAIALLFTGPQLFTADNDPETSVSPTDLPAGRIVSTIDPTEIISRYQKFTSQEATLTLRYPEDWYITDTTPVNGQGPFGTLYQSWTLSNFPMKETGEGGVAENTVKIDFVISQAKAGMQLDEAIDCGMKTTDCAEVTVNGVSYRKSTATLNTGMISVAWAAIKNGKLYQAGALIATGTQQESNKQIVEAIFASQNISEMLDR